MRAKEEKCLVTFRTTTGAMAMERCCKQVALEGRLIPVPRSISAGCGMCWISPVALRDSVEELILKEKLDTDGIYTMLL